jgi:hypothetical protein
MDSNSEELLNSLPDELAMNTKVWGPPTWFFLHSMAMAYPKKIDIKNSIHVEIKQQMYAFLSALGHVLPCPICGDSYSEYITRKDYLIWKQLDSRKDLTYFIYRIHNRVNEKLGVASCNIPSFYEVLNFYSRFIAGSPCIETTEKERNNSKNKMCKNINFKQYKCIVNVMDTYNNITEIPQKEQFKNKDNFDENLDENFKFSFDFGHLLLIIIICGLLYYIFFQNKIN